MSFVNRMSSDLDSMSATLDLVRDDPNFDKLHPATQEAVNSFFEPVERASDQLALEIGDADLPASMSQDPARRALLKGLLANPGAEPLVDMGPSWRGNTPNGPWEGS